jgi:HlyD family secretion protein
MTLSITPGSTIRVSRLRWFRQGHVLVTVVIAAAVLAVVSGVLGSRFASPRQIAAQAAPPPLVQITQPVTYGVLKATIGLRAQIVYANALPVGLPDDLSSELPVVTSSNVNVGSRVSEGEVLFSVAERPVIVFEGDIPAFRDMAPGDSGVDVSELQAALAAMGYSTEPDAPGQYGAGTSSAVARFYQSIGFQVIWSPANAPAQLAQLNSAASQAKASLSTALASLTEARASSKTAATVPAAKAAVQSATSALTSAEHALVAGENSMGAEVPRGEVMFVPTLPAEVESSKVFIGRELSTKTPVLTIGSGALMLKGQVGTGSRAGLRAGEAATATSDITGASFHALVARVASSPTLSSSSNVPSYAVTLKPSTTVPASLVSQNVGVVIQTGSTSRATFIVPVSAVITAATGATFVDVKGDGNRVRRLPVRPGLVSGGKEAVHPLKPDLRSGMQVVVGVATRAFVGNG